MSVGFGDYPENGFNPFEFGKEPPKYLDTGCSWRDDPVHSEEIVPPRYLGTEVPGAEPWDGEIGGEIFQILQGEQLFRDILRRNFPRKNELILVQYTTISGAVDLRIIALDSKSREETEENCGSFLGRYVEDVLTSVYGVNSSEMSTKSIHYVPHQKDGITYWSKLQRIPSGSKLVPERSSGWRITLVDKV